MVNLSHSSQRSLKYLPVHCLVVNPEALKPDRRGLLNPNPPPSPCFQVLESAQHICAMLLEVPCRKNQSMLLCMYFAGILHCLQPLEPIQYLIGRKLNFSTFGVLIR